MPQTRRPLVEISGLALLASLLLTGVPSRGEGEIVTQTFHDGGTASDVSFCLANAPGDSFDLAAFEGEYQFKQYNPPYMRVVASVEAASGCDGVVVIKHYGGLFETQYEADILSARTGRLMSHIDKQPESAFLGDLFMAANGVFGGARPALKAEMQAASAPAAPPPAIAAPAAAAQEARQASAMEESVREKIPEWLALKMKPSMPSEAHRYKVLAEDAVHEKRFADAVKYYEQALAVFPLWPEGQFNAALLDGELRRFPLAASHMRLYVALAPNAKDIQVAQDKLIVWEEKAKNAYEASPGVDTAVATMPAKNVPEGPRGALLLLAAAGAPIEWVAIAPGTYMMGWSAISKGNPYGEHPVTVKAFALGKTLVTNKQYAVCEKAGACPARRCVGNWPVPEGDDTPAGCVTWKGADAFVRWVGARLPSEAEWEYAARGQGKNIAYPWGNEAPDCSRGAFLGCGGPLPVCSRPAGNTEQGLCDMAGEDSQWMEDFDHDSFDGAPADGSAWVTAPGPKKRYGVARVIRGSSFSMPPLSAANYGHGRSGDDWAARENGFRLAR